MTSPLLAALAPLLVLTAGVLAGLLLARAGARRALDGRARHVRAALGDRRAAAATLEEGARVTLEGTLVAAEGAPQGAREVVVTAVPRGAELLEEASPKAITAARGELCLALSDGRVGLDGPLQVLVGSADTGRALPAAKARAWLPEGEAPSLPAAEVAVRTLSVGDRVIATGVVRRVAAADGAATYRTRDVVHRLAATTEGDADAGSSASPVVPLVFAGAPRPLGRDALRYVGHGVAGALAAAGLLAIAQTAGLVRLAPAAALRPQAIFHPCKPDIDARLDHGDIASAAADAEACGDDLRAARAHWLLADFDRASRAFLAARAAGVDGPPSLSEVGAHLLAGRTREAAQSARDLAAHGDVIDPAHRTTLECLADALDLRAGDTAALARLGGRVAVAHTPSICAVLLADTKSDASRLDALRDVPVSVWSPTRDPVGFAAGLLRWEVDRKAPLPRAHDFYPLGALNAPKGLVLPQPMGLVASALEHIDGSDRKLKVGYLELSAVFASYLGDHAGAGREITRALALSELGRWRYGAEEARAPAFRFEPTWTPLDEGTDALRARLLGHRHLLFLASILATRARDLGSARQYLDLAYEETHGAAALRPVLALLERGDRQGIDHLRRSDTWAPNRPLWDAALAGDEIKLALALGQSGSDGRAVLPLAGAYLVHSEALRDWFRAAYPPACWTCGPHVLTDWLAGKLEVARALGASDATPQLELAIGRLREALLRRDVAVPLLALGRIAPL